jgi:hypothetical protein
VWIDCGNPAIGGPAKLLISNLGGPGALTTGDGILVVEAINGGTTASGVFGLASAVAAGPFEYLLRLQANVQADATLLKPYLKANLWHTFADTDPVVFAATPIMLERRATAFEIGGGIAAQLTRAFSIYGAASYTTNISSADRRSVAGNLGLRLTW